MLFLIFKRRKNKTKNLTIVKLILAIKNIGLVRGFLIMLFALQI